MICGPDRSGRRRALTRCRTSPEEPSCVNSPAVRAMWPVPQGPLSALRAWAETYMPEIDRCNQLADETLPKEGVDLGNGLNVLVTATR